MFTLFPRFHENGHATAHFRRCFALFLWLVFQKFLVHAGFFGSFSLRCPRLPCQPNHTVRHSRFLRAHAVVEKRVGAPEDGVRAFPKLVYVHVAPEHFQCVHRWSRQDATRDAKEGRDLLHVEQDRRHVEQFHIQHMALRTRERAENTLHVPRIVRVVVLHRNRGRRAVKRVAAMPAHLAARVRPRLDDIHFAVQLKRHGVGRLLQRPHAAAAEYVGVRGCFIVLLVKDRSRRSNRAAIHLCMFLRIIFFLLGHTLCRSFRPFSYVYVVQKQRCGPVYRSCSSC